MWTLLTLGADAATLVGMDNIYERFAALPRGRRGSKIVVIVDEDVLTELIGDAQAAEADLVLSAVRAGAKPAPRVVAPQYLLDPDPNGPVVAMLVETPRASVVDDIHNQSIARNRGHRYGYWG